mmetsp:Transcript_53951/g.97135  ORF Transcript_53951/g.97135 Transcript_53951/m.97135 type:complete len:255 (+) Transcript_53951:220-984(+)
MFDAAAVGQLHDGAASTAGMWPCNHTRTSDAAPSHRLAEHSGGAIEECRLSVAREAPSAPLARREAHLSLHLALEARAVALVAYEVDVECLHRAVPGRIHDEGAPRAAAHPASRVHPLIVVSDVATVDVFHAGSCAPHLAPGRGPAAPTALEEWPLRRIALGSGALRWYRSGRLRRLGRRRRGRRGRVPGGVARGCGSQRGHGCVGKGAAAPQGGGRGRLPCRGGEEGRGEEDGSPHRGEQAGPVESKRGLGQQ